MSNKKLTVAIIGCGPFAHHFVSLFKAHPNVEKVYVCDLIEEKVQAFAEEFDVDIIDTYEEALAREDINCIANFTQRHLHGDVVIRALEAGKNVYSAVPMASTVDECKRIVELVEKTGLTYMLGETCYYYPCAMFCREAYRDGRIGELSYAAAQYYHHIDAISYGKRPAERGMPPLLYPTHSTAMVLSACDSYATHVACFGCPDRTGDPAFTPEGNEWGNTDINQTFIMKLANGAVVRINESRGLGYKTPSSYISGFYGTKGSYEFSNAQHLLYERYVDEGEEKIHLTDVSDYVNGEEMTANKHLPDFKEQVANGKWQWNILAPIQKPDHNRLPKEFEGLVNGHMGSHQYLIDDFCTATYEGTLPTVNAWLAARYNLPGLVALESAKQGGIMLEVPDLGEPKIKN